MPPKLRGLKSKTNSLGPHSLSGFNVMSLVCETYKLNPSPKTTTKRQSWAC